MGGESVSFYHILLYEKGWLRPTSSYEGDTKNNSEAWRHVCMFVLVILSSNTNMKFPIFVRQNGKMVVHQTLLVLWPPLDGG